MNPLNANEKSASSGTPQSPARWQDEIDQREVLKALHDWLALGSPAYAEYRTVSDRLGLRISFAPLKLGLFHVAVKDCEPWRGGRPTSGKNRNYFMEITLREAEDDD